MSAEGDNTMHRIKGGVTKVCQQGLFLHDPDGDSGGQNLKYQLG